MRRIAAFSVVVVLACVGAAVPHALGQTPSFKGVCEDLFVPDYPEAGDPGLAIDDFYLVPPKAFKSALDDCAKRAKGFFASDKVKLAAMRLQATAGDTSILPELRKLSVQGVSEASYLIHAVYNRSQPVPPHRLKADDVTRSEAERELRKAAEQGHRVAIANLSQYLTEGVVMRRDWKEARVWSEKWTKAADSNINRKAAAWLQLAALYAQDPQSSETERARIAGYAGEIAKSAFLAPNAVWLEVRGRRLGIGWKKDEAAARAKAETSGLLEENPPLKAEYIEILRASKQPQDHVKLVEILEAAKPARSRLYDGTVGDMLFSGDPGGRDRARAFAFLVTRASRNHEEAVNLAKLITAHGRRVEIPPEMLRRMYEAVDLKIPDADETLVRLKGSLASDAYNDEDASGLRRHFGASSEGMALLILERVANAGPSSIYVPFDSEKAAVTALDALVAKGVPVALRIKGFALRRGKIYRQDDVEATKHLIKAAEAGDALAMKLVADAYSSGTGVGENRAEEWRWLKAAAKAGNVEAQSHLINLMTFRRHYPGYNVHDAFLQSVVLAAEDDSPFGVLSGLSRVIDREDIESLGVEYLAASVMDGFRASMAARNDTVMVRIFKSTPDPVRRGVEEILKRDGFLSAEPDGFMGPAARTALASWARSKGLPEIESDRPPAPPEADARMTGVPIIPPEVLKALRVKAFNGANKAKGKDDIKAPMQMLALLAQYGDMVPRLELLKNYSGVRAVRDAVPPGLAALYGFDVLISRPPGSEKAPVDFVFAVTHMAQNGSLPIAAEAFLYTLRDDPRLRQIEIFDSVVDRFIFVPDYCDHIRQAASKAKVGGLDSDGCSGASRRALLAWAKAAGPMGVEAQLRREAAEAILKAPK